MISLRWILFLFFALPLAARAGDGAAFFDAKVRPLLARRCFECHSHEKKIKGGLALDSRSGWEKGGDSGPAVAPGKPDESLLIKAIGYQDKDLAMPPKTKLDDAEIAIFTEWVKMGAPDPRESVAAKSGVVSFEERCKHWCFQSVRNPPAPTVNDSAWPRGDLDRFVLARLDAEGLQPSAQAEPRVLLRR
ncbi:MAG TPA: c-type cytochrome domain-containing protein, partial [Chthoniobacteraceae bacterium]|nr:c-type cytochrome domain-containing protein [Chthoniobacteraceae bacterium]